MKRVIIILLFLTAVTSGYMGWATLAPHYAEAKYREYYTSIQNGNLESALTALNKAIFFNSKDVKYYWARARLYWMLFQENALDAEALKCSKEDWLKIINLKDEDGTWSRWSDVYFGIAQAEFNLGEFDQSASNYLCALRHTSDPVRRGGIAVLLGYIYFTQENYNKAIQWLDKVPENDRDYVKSCLWNATSNHRLHNFKRAEELYLKYLAIRPHDPEVNSYLAYLYAEQGAYTKSIKYLKSGLIKVKDICIVFDTMSQNIYTQVETSVYLKLFNHFFERFQDELESYVAGDFAEDSVEMKKLNTFYQSVNKVVVNALDNPNPEVSGYAEVLIGKINEAGLYRKGACEKGQSFDICVDADGSDQ